MRRAGRGQTQQPAMPCRRLRQHGRRKLFPPCAPLKNTPRCPDARRKTKKSLARTEVPMMSASRLPLRSQPPMTSHGNAGGSQALQAVGVGAGQAQSRAGRPHDRPEGVARMGIGTGPQRGFAGHAAEDQHPRIRPDHRRKISTTAIAARLQLPKPGSCQPVWPGTWPCPPGEWHRPDSSAPPAPRRR